MKFNYLAQPDNVANILTVRKDAFSLTDDYNFSYDEALSLLIPTYFKKRLMKIYNRQQDNLHRWNQSQNELIREKTKLEYSAFNQRIYLSQLDRRFIS